MNRRVLCVDDEPAVLDGIRRNLRKDFEIHTETDPCRAVEILQSEPAFAVIVADMRMPKMDGVELLYQARKIAPMSVRLMLTGDAQRSTAINAVNRGDVFKFVSKPCDADVLRKVLELAVRQYDIGMAEKEVLENTVRGSVSALAEVLALAKPTAFGRVQRLRTLALGVGAELPDCDAWELDTAASLSQLGTVSLPAQLLEKLASGQPLSEAEREEYHKHPALGAELVRKVPRLEGVADAILYQLKDYDGAGPPADGLRGAEIPLSARVLRAVLAYDELRSRGHAAPEALAALMAEPRRFDRRVLEALTASIDHAAPDALPVAASQLECGMVVERDVTTDFGMLLLSRGQEITPAVRVHLRRFHSSGTLSAPIWVSRPATAPAQEEVGPSVEN